MAIQRLRVTDCTILAKTGIQSQQLIWSNNSPDAQVTITHVTMAPGAVSKRHAHAHAEQIWIIELGEGLLLMADDCSESLRQGDIVRTPAGEVHGVENTGSGPLIYLAVTTPPQNFAKAYDPSAGDQRQIVTSKRP